MIAALFTVLAPEQNDAPNRKASMTGDYRFLCSWCEMYNFVRCLLRRFYSKFAYAGKTCSLFEGNTMGSPLYPKANPVSCSED